MCMCVSVSVSVRIGQGINTDEAALEAETPQTQRPNESRLRDIEDRDECRAYFNAHAPVWTMDVMLRMVFSAVMLP
jgi:hypothetical protein